MVEQGLVPGAEQLDTAQELGGHRTEQETLLPENVNVATEINLNSNNATLATTGNGEIYELTRLIVNFM